MAGIQKTPPPPLMLSAEAVEMVGEAVGVGAVGGQTGCLWLQKEEFYLVSVYCERRPEQRLLPATVW